MNKLWEHCDNCPQCNEFTLCEEGKRLFEEVSKLGSLFKWLDEVPEIKA